MYGCQAAKKKEIEKDLLKVEVPIIFVKGIILGHPCIPCAGLTRVAIRSDSVGRYEAQRVKGEFHVITCNLTASAPHLLVSAVPRI